MWYPILKSEAACPGDNFAIRVTRQVSNGLMLRPGGSLAIGLTGLGCTPCKGKGLFGFFKGGSALKRPAENSDTSAGNVNY